LKMHCHSPHKGLQKRGINPNSVKKVSTIRIKQLKDGR